MRKYIFILIVVLIAGLFFLFSPEDTGDRVEVYADLETNLLVPQKNTVIAVVDLSETNRSLFNRRTLLLLKEFQTTLQEMEGVSKVESLLNAQVVISQDDDIIVSSLIPSESARHTAAFFDRLQGEIPKFPELKPYINTDQDTLLFYVHFTYSVQPVDIDSQMADCRRLYAETLPFEYTGRGPILAQTEELLTKDIVVFFPILLILVMLVFLSFRNLKAILFAWLLILLAVYTSYNFIHFLGIEDTPLILLIPVFSLGLLSDYLIHYFYHLFYEPDLSGRYSVRRRLLFPLSLTALSTLTGFLSLIFLNGSGHLQLGSLISASVGLTFLGVFLCLPYWSFRPSEKELLPRFRDFQIRLFQRISRRRKLIFLGVAVISVWSLFQLPNLQIEPYPIEQLPAQTTIKQADLRINREFYGTVPYFIEIDTSEKNGVLSKETMLTMDSIHRELEANPSVGFAYSLLTVLKRMNFYFQGSEESLLESSEFDDIFPMLIEQYLLYFSSSVDPLEYESMLDASYRYLSIRGLAYYENVEDLEAFNQIIASIRSDLPEGWTLSVHGMIEELDSEKRRLTNNWIISFLIGSFLIFITVLIFYRKIRMALMSLVPGFISMIFSFGIISSASISIDTFSIIFVAIITGLVIDYSIHTLAAIESMVEQDRRDEGFGYIINYSGLPIFLSFLTSLFSFSVLFLSSFKGARSLGLLLFSSLIISFFLSLYLLPLILLNRESPKKEIVP